MQLRRTFASSSSSSPVSNNCLLVGEKDRFNAISVDFGDGGDNERLAADIGRFSQVLQGEKRGYRNVYRFALKVL